MSRRLSAVGACPAPPVLPVALQRLGKWAWYLPSRCAASGPTSASERVMAIRRKPIHPAPRLLLPLHQVLEAHPVIDTSAKES